MVKLIWKASDFGIAVAEVKANYETLEEARAQALHDLGNNRSPLRIEAEDGTVLWDVASLRPFRDESGLVQRIDDPNGVAVWTRPGPAKRSA